MRHAAVGAIAIAVVAALALPVTGAAEPAANEAYRPEVGVRVASARLNALFGLRILPDIYVAGGQATVGVSGGGGGGGGGSFSASDPHTWTGAQTFLDNKFVICDAADNTKCLAVNVPASFTTGTTRTMNLAAALNSDFTVAMQDQPNVFTNTNEFTATRLLLHDLTDPTKTAFFDLSNLLTGALSQISVPDASIKLPIMTQFLTFSGPTAARTYTLPNANATLAATNSSNTWTGTQTFDDNAFVLRDNVDTTKLAQFQLSGITTGTTRTITVPDSDITLPIATQTLTFSGPTAARTYTLPDAAETIATLGQTQVFTGSNTFTDNSFVIADNLDSTKKFQFQAASISTGTTRTVTVPNGSTTIPIIANQITISGLSGGRTITFVDSNQTVAATNLSQTFSQAQGFSNNITVSGGQTTFANDIPICFAGTCSGTANIFNTITAETPDTTVLATGSVSNAWHVFEAADGTFDFNNGACGTAACTDPSWTIHSHNQDTTQYTTLAAYGVAGGMRKTLTESSATAFVQIPVASGAGTGGTVEYTVFASDGTDHQARSGSIKFSVVNKAGTETCAIAPAAATELTDGNAAAISAGTLTYTFGTDTAPTNACDLTLNAISSLTQTTLEIRYIVTLAGPGQPTPQ